MDKIDIVIPLGNGSKWDNNELRYCLRSIEKYANNFDRVFIIGREIPNWIDAFKVEKAFPPMEIEGRPAYNIMEKLYWACDIRDLSDKFLYFNDDYFLTSEIDCVRYPNYYEDSLSEIAQVHTYNWYLTNINNTINVLKGNTTYNYDVHYPIMLSKIYFKDVMDSFDWTTNEYCIKSLYGNRMKVNHKAIKDCKIRGTHSLKEFIKLSMKGHMFSTGDLCLTDEVKEYIKSLYPTKSKFER